MVVCKNVFNCTSDRKFWLNFKTFLIDKDHKTILRLVRIESSSCRVISLTHPELSSGCSIVSENLQTTIIRIYGPFDIDSDTDVFCRQHNFWNGLHGYQCYSLHMTTEKNYQKYKVVVKCEWTRNQSDPSDFAKSTRVSWTYLGVIFEQTYLSLAYNTNVHNVEKDTEPGATKKNVNVTRMKVIFKITKRHQNYVE